MGRAKNENIRKIQQIKEMSYFVTLPMNDIRRLGWKEHQKVIVELDKRRKRFIIKDWKKKR